tara:strand:+ start:59 stop:340 length:282 start_codon:yes stop_codon:yes gene_type:complete
MSDIYSPFIKFTYTIVDPKGRPNQKCHLVNLNFVIRVETGNNNDIKIFLTNNQIINVELGRDYKASSIINEILDFSAEGSDYNVYNISSFSEK